MKIKAEMKSGVIRSVVISMASAMVFVVGGATSASASTTCTNWSDGTTWGVKCRGNSYGYYQAGARCKDGAEKRGGWHVMNTGEWSYAYCSGHGGLRDIWEEYH